MGEGWVKDGVHGESGQWINHVFVSYISVTYIHSHMCICASACDLAWLRARC